MRRSLLDPDVRAQFMAALADTGYFSHASLAAGLSPHAGRRMREQDPAFRAVTDAVVEGRGGAPRARQERLRAAHCDAFLVEFATLGSVQRAAAAVGVTVAAVYYRRTHDADFASRWAAARNQALDRIEDRLFDAALDGFTRVETGTGGTRTVTTQNATAMFKLLATRRNGERAGIRTVELTPALLEAARDKLARQLRHAAETGSADALIAALPAPTVSVA